MAKEDEIDLPQIVGKTVQFAKFDMDNDALFVTFDDGTVFSVQESEPNHHSALRLVLNGKEIRHQISN